jgi:hypothetical protein
VSLPKINTKRLTGQEHPRNGHDSDGWTVRDFWAWSSSDLLSNAKRGVFAEFLVASALNVADGVRAEWDAFDLVTKSGARIEVKSAAYIQSWYQAKLSTIGFSISKSQAWDPDTNKLSPEKLRQADVYVFCLLDHKDQRTVDPLDMAQWQFYVLATKKLNEACGNLKRLSLKRLLELEPEVVQYEQLERAIQRVVGGS